MNVAQIIDRTVSVLAQPQWYFTSDDDALDFADGAVYAATMGIIGALLGLIFSGALFEGNGFLNVIIAAVAGPVGAIIGAFIGAGIIYAVCKFLDSRKDFESSFSISAAAAALYPVNAVLGFVPVAGPLIALAWSWWIVTEGAAGVHNIDRGSLRISFGAIYLALALLSMLF